MSQRPPLTHSSPLLVYDVAEGTPPEHDTTMVTLFAPEPNVTRAVAAGPRVTEVTS
jgi:hypothetical protein